MNRETAKIVSGLNRGQLEVLLRGHNLSKTAINKAWDRVKDVKKALGKIGYIYEGDLGIKDRIAFTYIDKPHLKKHHLYVCPQYSEELHRHITFRDFLRSNPEAVRKYSLIKEKAAELFPNDIDGYIEYKSPCIEELYKECGLK